MTQKIKRNIGKWLRGMGFDESYYKRVDFGEGHWKVKCSQCEACTINGIPCHETGCPNQVRDDDED